jgi:hypothetical protein
VAGLRPSLCLSCQQWRRERKSGVAQRISISGLPTMAARHEWWEDRRRLPLEAAADHDLECLVACRSLFPSFLPSFLPSFPPSFPPSLLSWLHTLISLQKHHWRILSKQFLFALTQSHLDGQTSCRGAAANFPVNRLTTYISPTPRSKKTRYYLCEVRDPPSRNLGQAKYRTRSASEWLNVSWSMLNS